MKKALILIGLLMGLLLGPYIAVYIQYGGIPDRFFNFPAISPGNPKPAPTLIMTVGISIVFIAALLLLIVPRLFGFKKTPPVAKLARRKTRAGLPPWFFIGGGAPAGTLLFFPLPLPPPPPLHHWSLPPLLGGF